MEVGALEAGNMLGALLDRVEGGEEVLIVRHGKAVARLVPNERPSSTEQAFAALKRIRERASKLQPPGFDWEELKKDRDAGRP